MLEKGKHGRNYPQAFFPWNNDLEISDLQDRRYLKHESFALATRHAHLPVPGEVKWKPGMQEPLKTEGLDSGKRPMFDLGIFEIPNMLSLEGREPGTVGMRWFLEVPIADSKRIQGGLGKHARKYANDQTYPHMPAFEALRSLGDTDGALKLGKHGPQQDRLKLISEGAHSWKRIGLRDISVKTIADRLSLVDSWRDEIVHEGWKVTVLDKQSCTDLHNHLFREILYPPHGHDSERHSDLKIQIEALVKVLTIPGAWLDFSLAQTRLELGRVLWQESRPRDTRGSVSGEKKWLLIQLLLSVELVIRLEAALRLGVSRGSDSFSLTGEEIHHFDKLRNLKVDWDLLVARRLLDLCYVTAVAQSTANKGVHSEEPLPKHGYHHLLSDLRNKLTVHDEQSRSGAWHCVILPRQPRVMVDGLERFAKNIGWPRAEETLAALKGKLMQSHQGARDYLTAPCTDHDFDEKDAATGRVTLQQATTNTVGGWLSRSWLSGLVLPGFSTCGLLMSCLVENDEEAIARLGTKANLHGGIVLAERSWWSKTCIVGRVVAAIPGGQESMGWIGTYVLPNDHNGNAIPDSWVSIEVEPAPNLREDVRIHDVERLSVDGSPLGTGQGKIQSTEFSMVTDHIFEALKHTKVNFKQLSLTLARHDLGGKPSSTATASCELALENGVGDSIATFNLRYDVYFVTAHPCRLPHGHAVMAGNVHEHQHPYHMSAEHLPAHPLHRSYIFAAKSLQDFQDSEPPDPTRHESETWIVDAREQADADVFTRAWCAQAGRHALVARTGNTCLSCAIREAKALQIGIIIRVGSWAKA